MYAAFAHHDLLSLGPIHQVAEAAHAFVHQHPNAGVLVLRVADGAVVDLDFQGDLDGTLAQLDDHPMVPQAPPPAADPEPAPRKRGRPKLGVQSREISLLPKHWEWLQHQGRSASAALRLLIEKEMKATAAASAKRQRDNGVYALMTVLAGDLPGFEDACRALFQGDGDGLRQRIQGWPAGIRQVIEHRWAE